jgi:hypothetical protein
MESQSCTTSFTSSSYQISDIGEPSKGPDRWKSEGGRFGLYAGWSRTTNFSSQRGLFMVWAVVYEVKQDENTYL